MKRATQPEARYRPIPGEARYRTAPGEAPFVIDEHTSSMLQRYPALLWRLFPDALLNRQTEFAATAFGIVAASYPDVALEFLDDLEGAFGATRSM